MSAMMFWKILPSAAEWLNHVFQQHLAISTCPLEGPSLKLNSHWLGTSPVPSSPQFSSDWPKFFQTTLYNWHIFSSPLIWASTWTRFIYHKDGGNMFLWNIRTCLLFGVKTYPQEMVISWLNCEHNLAQYLFGCKLCILLTYIPWLLCITIWRWSCCGTECSFCFLLTCCVYWYEQLVCCRFVSSGTWHCVVGWLVPIVLKDRACLCLPLDWLTLDLFRMKSLCSFDTQEPLAQWHSVA